MKIKDFIGKVVIGTASKRRYVITEITSPYITARVEKPDSGGHYTFYRWGTINGDPITNGTLVFENGALNESFKRAFDEYSRTEDAYWEEYGYWMRRD